MDWTLHPISLVQQLIEAYGFDLAFEFSVYRYIPLSTADTRRRSFWLSSQDITIQRLQTELNALGTGEELSIHSRVATPSRRFHHIPMIDFSGELDETKLRILHDTLPPTLTNQLAIFRSGKSYHGYISSLLEEDDWYSFCGLLLLMNLPDSAPIIDSRWIGHRLRGGYSALRWSCNTGDHSVYPQRIGSFDEIRANRLFSADCH
jgi:hypothetical protein